MRGRALSISMTLVTQNRGMEKGCEHDYKNYVRKGRAKLHCPKCDEDITTILVLMFDVMEKHPADDKDNY